jgi:molecular chaperone GrpE
MDHGPAPEETRMATMTDGRKAHQKREHGTQAGGDAKRHAEETAAPAASEAPAAVGAEVRVGELEALLAEAQTERDAYLDHLRRLQAEFDNYRKRVRRDEEALRVRASEDVVEALLPVIDNMQRACEAAAVHDEGQVAAGVERVTGQLYDLLAARGLEEIATAPGDPFDPTIQEAVMAQPSADVPEGHIVAVTQRGYRLHDRLLRAARVVVSSGPPVGKA